MLHPAVLRMLVEDATGRRHVIPAHDGDIFHKVCVRLLSEGCLCSSESHRFCDRVQDAYTMRCCPQVPSSNLLSPETVPSEWPGHGSHGRLLSASTGSWDR